MSKFNKTKKEMVDCLRELAEEFGLSFQDFIDYNEKNILLIQMIINRFIRKIKIYCINQIKFMYKI